MEPTTSAGPEAVREVPLPFDALYRACAADLFAYVATLLRDRAASEDVTAQTFERAFRRRRTYDARRGTQRAWLFAIARNAALDELRRRRRTVVLAAEPADLDGAAASGGEEARVRDGGDGAHVVGQRGLELGQLAGDVGIERWLRSAHGRPLAVGSGRGARGSRRWSARCAGRPRSRRC